jgi:gamma-glutamyltranspeptidase/glutathione hydrolase
MSTGQHRGVVVGRQGMVAASQPLAVSAGLNVLQGGGNFVDAALATSAVLCVTEPYASQVGGDAFIIVYDAKTGQTTALNASGAAPQAATLEHFADGIPLRGLSAASVPGLVDAWFTLHGKWGTKPVGELLAPAVRYAEEGFPAGFRYARNFAAQEELLRTFPSTTAVMLPEGAPPEPGQMVRQPDLAWTLRQIAAGGRDAFYTGAVAERILRYSAENGGLFAAADFAAHKTQVSDPIKTTYHGYTVHGQPPVSQGHILLQMLNLVEGFDLGALGHNSTTSIHYQVEAKKLAFADRAAYLGDPEFVDVPMETLLSKPYAEQRRHLIQPLKAATHVEAGTIDHDTTYFCVADAEGNAISFIQSVFWGFGCAEVAAGTGVLFNNRMTGFSLDLASPNVLAPGKRTAHTLNAYLITKEAAEGETREKLAFVGGTPGGDVQVQSNLQVICNLIDFGLNPQEAVEAPRWQHGGAVGAADEPSAGQLAIENRVALDVVLELEKRGHKVNALGPWAHSSAYQVIAVHPETGAFMAGSDPRCDGHAAGF